MTLTRAYFRTDQYGQVWMSLDGADEDSHWWPVWLWEERPEFECDEEDVEILLYGPPVGGVN